MQDAHDILVRYNGENAKVKVDDGRFAIRLKDTGSLVWASEKYGGIESGSLRDLENLIDDHAELGTKGEFALVGLEFTHRGKGKALLGKLSDSIRIDDNGVVVLNGKIVDDIKTSDGIDHLDRIGSEHAKLHNKHNHRSFSVVSSDIQLHIDTHTQQELTRLHGGADKIPNIHPLGEQDTSLRYGLSGASDDLGARDKLSGKVIDFSKDYKVGPATLNLKTTVTPVIDAVFKTPDNAWESLNADQYSLDASLRFDWDMTLTLTSPANNGSFQLSQESWKGLPVSYPVVGAVSANFGSGLDLASNLTLPGVAGSYSFGASQTLGKKFTVRSTGVTDQDLSSSVSTRKPSFDSITGLELNAVASPYIDLAIGMTVPDWVPVLGGSSLADITGKLLVPINYNLSLGDLNAFTIGISADLNASINALTFKDDWKFTKQLASGSIFDWTSSNLIA
jgi:hypothetical protein